MRELIARLLVCALLAQGASAATASDKAKPAPSRSDAERQAFLAYKARETGQLAGAAAKAASGPQDKQAQLKSEIDKFNLERKAVRTVAYGSTFGQGPGTTPRN